MTCFLCGHEETHHLGCLKADFPELTIDVAVAAGLMAMPAEAEGPPVPVVEVLKEGTMTTVPEMRTVGQCEFEGCDNPKYSDSPRTKYCGDHKDPKNRKE